MQNAAKANNRFHLLVAGYAGIFAILAFFGAVEASRMHDEQIHVQKETADKIASVTHNQVLYNLPQMDVTVIGGISAHHLSLGISLQMNKDYVERFSDFQPLVSDRIISFLGHEDIYDFNNPHGMSMLRKDLLSQANAASGPVVISDVIFREFVVR